MSKWYDAFRPHKDDLGFEPDDAAKLEIAKRRIANFTDDPAWSWLAPLIKERKMTWTDIFQIVADHL